jgi:hypothetical protein
MVFRKSLLLGIGIISLSTIPSRAMEQLKAGDSIQIELAEEAEEQKKLMKEKCDEYEKLINSDDQNVAVQATLRLAVTYDSRQQRGEAIAYWRALTNQKASLGLRAQAFEVLGIYARDNRVHGHVTLDDPKTYFIRARDESPLEDSDIKTRAIAELNCLNSPK